jgi:hypothetical protein
VTLAVTNPTKYPARISIFAETAAQSKLPLAYTAYLHWPQIELASGQSGTWHIRKTGDLTLEPMSSRSGK